MASLFPAIEPYETGTLDVGDGHLLYWEAAGNPNGLAAVPKCTTCRRDVRPID